MTARGGSDDGKPETFTSSLGVPEPLSSDRAVWFFFTRGRQLILSKIIS